MTLSLVCAVVLALLVGWVLPDSGARIESQALLASLSMTAINLPSIGA